MFQLESMIKAIISGGQAKQSQAHVKICMTEGSYIKRLLAEEKVITTQSPW